MKALLQNDYVALTVRLFLGLLFVIISIDKIHDPSLFAASVENYRVLPQSGAMVVGTVLPWIELLCGIFLVTGVMIRGSSLLISFLMVVFIAAILSALARGLDILCGCFTLDPGATRIGWNKVVENTGLLLLGIFLIFSESSRFSLERYLRGRHSDD